MATVASKYRSLTVRSFDPEPDTRSQIRDGVCLRIPPRAFTWHGFREWVKSDDFPDEVRVTFLRGEMYLDTSKEELETHVKVKQEVSRVLLTLNNDQDLGEFYADGPLVSNEAAEVSNNPDGVFVSYTSLDAGRVRLIPREDEQGQYMEIEGTPDWILEVVSRSSVGKDTRELRRAYHEAGISEYWLIDARGPEIEFQILHWRKKGYVTGRIKEGWQRSRVFGCSFRLDRRRTSRGLWRYELKVSD